MDIKEVARDKSYDQIHVNDESDRQLYIDAFVDGANVLLEEIEDWLRNYAEHYVLEGGIAINSMISRMKEMVTK